MVPGRRVLEGAVLGKADQTGCAGGADPQAEDGKPLRARSDS